MTSILTSHIPCFHQHRPLQLWLTIPGTQKWIIVTSHAWSKFHLNSLFTGTAVLRNRLPTGGFSNHYNLDYFKFKVNSNILYITSWITLLGYSYSNPIPQTKPLPWVALWSRIWWTLVQKYIVVINSKKSNYNVSTTKWELCYTEYCSKRFDLNKFVILT